jgi:hypothetical protein
VKLVLGHGERSQIPHHKLVLGGNQGIGIVTCSYYQHVGHLCNRYPFVNDRLKQLLREEMMNVHQPILPTTTIVVPNVSILRT